MKKSFLENKILQFFNITKFNESLIQNCTTTKEKESINDQLVINS